MQTHIALLQKMQRAIPLTIFSFAFSYWVISVEELVFKKMYVATPKEMYMYIVKCRYCTSTKNNESTVI